MRMKKMGFLGVEEATTCMGEAVLPPSDGLEMVSGKLFEPWGYGGSQVEDGGSQAGGAGSELFFGDHVIGTGGVAEYDG
jgi:hypothetical protein